MSSLAERPELVGFFSYSRKDDEHSGGGLSRLRKRIDAELRLQLGRGFRLWQDTEAIPEGALWEERIKGAIAESVFFIPIVTPSAVTSAHCRSEFQYFLNREAALGRDNLIFPLLYVRVQALEIEDQWRHDDVLRIIGSRQYFDYQKLRQRSFDEADVGERIESYCRNIVDTLNQPWISPEERRRVEETKARQLAEAQRVEAEARRAAEEEQRLKQAEVEARQRADRERAEAERRAAEEETRRKAEAKALERAEKDHVRKKEEAQRREEQELEQAFAAAKRADSISAIDTFLASQPPETHRYMDKVHTLRAALVERDDAFKVAMAGYDVAKLKSFLNLYPEGDLADQVRSRLPPQPRRSITGSDAFESVVQSKTQSPRDDAVKLTYSIVSVVLFLFLVVVFVAAIFSHR